MKEGEVGVACSTYGEKIHRDFPLLHLMERDNLDDLDIVKT